MKLSIETLENEKDVLEIKKFGYDVDIELTQVNAKLQKLEKKRKIYENLKKLSNVVLSRVQQEQEAEDDIDTLF